MDYDIGLTYRDKNKPMSDTETENAPSPEDLGAFCFKVTAGELRRILSSLSIGAQLIYPESHINVWLSFVRNLENNEDCNSMSCLDIADCIETSQDVRDAIDNRIFLEVTGATATYERLLEKLQEEFGETVTPVPPAGEDCRDYLFSGLLAVLDRLNTNNEDAFQIFEVETNFLEIAEGFMDVLPNVHPAQLLAGQAINYLTFVQDALSENYLAQWTATEREDLACDLLCHFYGEGGCGVVTIDELYDFFSNRVGVFLNPTIIDFLQTMEEIVLGDYSGIVDFVSLTMTIQLLMLRVADMPLVKIVRGQDDSVRRLLNVLALGMRESDDSWTLLCDPCFVPSPEILITFDDPSLYSVVYGTVDSGAGNPPPALINAVRVLEAGIYIWRATIEIASPIPSNRVDINFFFNRTSGGALAYTLTDTSNVVYETIASPAQNSWVTTSITIPDGTIIDRVELRLGSLGAGTVASIRMDNVRIYTDE